MRRSHIVAIAVVMFCTLASAATADGIDKFKAFWKRFHLDMQRNNHWPEPFQTQDRMAAKSYWQPFIAKGWQHENTLGSHHFDSENGTLSAAGAAKVYWIATQAPPSYRRIFVERARTHEETELRVDLVQQSVAQTLPSGPLPSVVRTGPIPRTINSSGGYNTFIWKNLETNYQPQMLGGGAAGGASAGGSGN